MKLQFLMSGYWYKIVKKVLPLIKDYLGIIYSYFELEKFAANFEQFYLVVRYMNLKAMKLGLKWNVK